MGSWYQGHISVSLDRLHAFQCYSESVWVFPKNVFQTQMHLYSLSQSWNTEACDISPGMLLFWCSAPCWLGTQL